MIDKEELYYLLSRRITNHLTDAGLELSEVDAEPIAGLARWLIDSGHVTEATMGLVAGNPSDSESAGPRE